MDPVGMAAGFFSLIILVGTAHVEHHNRKVTDCLMTNSSDNRSSCPEYKSVSSQLEEVITHINFDQSISNIATSLRK